MTLALFTSGWVYPIQYLQQPVDEVKPAIITADSLMDTTIHIVSDIIPPPTPPIPPVVTVKPRTKAAIVAKAVIQASTKREHIIPSPPAPPPTPSIIKPIISVYKNGKPKIKPRQ